MRKPSIQQRLKQNGLRLNKEQLDAVKQLEGPNVVIAGAGTGKTSLLVAKINYANMVDPGLEDGKVTKPELKNGTKKTQTTKQKFLSHSTLVQLQKVDQKPLKL